MSGGSVCASRRGPRGFLHGRELRGGAASSENAVLCGERRRPHAEIPVCSFSLPVSPPTILPGIATLQTPAAPRPAHLAGRETRFVSAAGVQCVLLLHAAPTRRRVPRSRAWCSLQGAAPGGRWGSRGCSPLATAEMASPNASWQRGGFLVALLKLSSKCRGQGMQTRCREGEGGGQCLNMCRELLCLLT